MIREVNGKNVEVRIIREMTKRFEEIKTEYDGDTRGEVVILFV